MFITCVWINFGGSCRLLEAGVRPLVSVSSTAPPAATGPWLFREQRRACVGGQSVGPSTRHWPAEEGVPLGTLEEP
jgi:hypothetical protein